LAVFLLLFGKHALNDIHIKWGRKDRLLSHYNYHIFFVAIIYVIDQYILTEVTTDEEQTVSDT